MGNCVASECVTSIHNVTTAVGYGTANLRTATFGIRTNHLPERKPRVNRDANASNA